MEQDSSSMGEKTLSDTVSSSLNGTVWHTRIRSPRRTPIGVALGLAILVSGLMMTGAQDAQPVVPRFAEETQGSGLRSRYDGDWEFMVGGGVSTFDCNADKLPDVFLSGGSNKAVLYRNTSPVGGSLKFVRAGNSGLELEGVTGAYPLDIDADGMPDLAVLRVGQNHLYRGVGNCRFERADARWNFEPGDDWSAAFAATWERGNWMPTLAVGNYIDRTRTEFPWGSCTPNQLYRPESNRPDSSGTRYARPTALKPSFCALSMLFTDWNRSGRSALRVSNDREYYKGGQEQLWDMHATPKLFNEDDGWRLLRIWGMGIASYDLNGDTFPEYYLTSMADNKLQTLASGPNQPTYADVAFKRGVTAHRPYTGDEVKPSTAWHAQFEDVNNDALVDLFVAKGNVARMPDFAMNDPNNLLLQRADGTFLESGDQAGVASVARGRGAMLVDLNLDGLLDLFVVNRWEVAQVWRNLGAADVTSTSSTNAMSAKPLGRWLQLELSQPGGNRNAIGSWVEVELPNRTAPQNILRREITVGGGHASGHLGWIHFGLGDASEARVRVQWPDGKWSAWQAVKADRFYRFDRTGGLNEWTAKK